MAEQPLPSPPREEPSAAFGVEVPLPNVEERYRLLMEQIKDYALFFLDAAGRVRDWNAGAERLLGYAPSEVVGQPVNLIFTDEDRRAGVPERELATAREKGRADDERWHQRKDGSRFWASGVVTALRGDDGQVKGFAKLMRDRTESRLLEVQLHERDRAKDEFLAILAHELRNPLAPILTSLQIMREALPEGPLLHQTRATIERQVRQLARMVDDLLDVSRVAEGKLHLHQETADLLDILQRAVETATPLLDARNHRLHLLLPSGPVPLRADTSRLQQVFANLLNNAAKYTEPGGDITLSLNCTGAEAVVAIADTGLGIAPSMLPKVFDLFAQENRARTRSAGGLGIGLTLVKRLVEMHGGGVEAHSTGVGQGSTFTVRLPLEGRHEAASRIGQLVQTVRAARPRLRVVVVDDNADSADSLSLMLRLWGHQVQSAYTGQGGLDAVRSFRPDVALLDLDLPDISGYEVAEQLRGEASAARPVFVALSGYGAESDRERSRRAGFRNHLVKPVTPEQMEDLLNRVAHGRETSRP